MTPKRWIYKPLPQTPEETATIAALAKAVNINPFLATLLWQRGISDYDEAKTFFRPELSQLHDPFLMKDMDLAVARLEEAFGNGEKILIYGDYDVDGTTSVATFYGFLCGYYDPSLLGFYIPDRYKEGYGVQQTGIDFAKENGFSLIVTLDCGIKSVELVAYAKSLDIDFIICDHHRPGHDLPPAVAVLDPKRDDCLYPFKELTGCGVGFKLLQAFCRKNGIDEVSKVFPYLDLLVVSIAADIVPIVGENRVMSHFGLKKINASPRTGLKALMEIASLKGKIDITGVVFGLSPRINAAGRIRHANDAVNLLLAEKEQAASDFAYEINKHNTDRKGHDSRITQEALTMIEEDDALKNANSTVLFRNDWHKGVIGIVASRCIEQYHRPTIILTESNGHAAGSARSVPGFDVYDAIEACAEHLIQFGGHTFAAGLTLELDQIENFRKKFEEVVSGSILPEQLSPMITIDMKLPLGQITEKFFKILEQMQPFGPQNMTPTFVAENVQLKGNPRILKEKHLKLDVFQEGSAVFGAIGFGMADFYEPLLAGQSFDICYQIEVNEFRGERNLQLMLKDIKVKDDFSER